MLRKDPPLRHGVTLVIPLSILALVVGGCGPDARSPSSRHGVFPSRSTLSEIASAPLKPVPPRSVVVVPSFRVNLDKDSANSPAERVVAEVAPDLVFTREARCAARELAVFHAEHSAFPDERVQRFIYGACGLPTPLGVIGHPLTGVVGPAVSDEAVLEAWKAQIKIPSAKGHAAGAWFTRHGDRATLIIVSSPPAAVTSSPADANGRVMIQGEAPIGTDMVLGLINQGRDRVAHCEADPYVTLPRYSLLCTLAEGDPWAWAAIATRTSGRVLLRTSGLILVRREDQKTLELPAVAAPVASTAGSAPPGSAVAILEGINLTRRNANLPSMSLARAQTAMNVRLAPHFFNAEASNEPDRAELIALGLMAGWDVSGTIRAGGFYGSPFATTHDQPLWLDYALEQPMGRYTLLQPDAEQVAIGASYDVEGATGIVVTTYSFFGREDAEANAARVLQHLAAGRRARNLAPATSLGSLPGVVSAAELARTNRRDPTEALNMALGVEANRTGRALRGWVMRTGDLDVLPFPTEMLSPTLSVTVVVRPYKPADSAWGAYLIYLVADIPAPRRVAEARSSTLR